MVGDLQTKHGLSGVCESFIAGLVNHYGALVHFLAPSITSLWRIQPRAFVGAYNIWGFNNKEAPIRVCYSNSPDEPITNFEIKTLDSTANIPLALATIVYLGVHGIKNKLKLNDPINIDPDTLTQNERTKLGIRVLPLSLQERRDSIFSKEG